MPIIRSTKTGKKLVFSSGSPEGSANSTFLSRSKISGRMLFFKGVGVWEKDFVIDDTNRRIYKVDLLKSLEEEEAKIYGFWKPKDENGDYITEKPIDITLYNLTWFDISNRKIIVLFEDGCIRQYSYNFHLEKIGENWSVQIDLTSPRYIAAANDNYPENRLFCASNSEVVEIDKITGLVRRNITIPSCVTSAGPPRTLPTNFLGLGPGGADAIAVYSDSHKSHFGVSGIGYGQRLNRRGFYQGIDFTYWKEFHQWNFAGVINGNEIKQIIIENKPTVWVENDGDYNLFSYINARRVGNWNINTIPINSLESAMTAVYKGINSISSVGGENGFFYVAELREGNSFSLPFTPSGYTYREG